MQKPAASNAIFSGNAADVLSATLVLQAAVTEIAGRGQTFRTAHLPVLPRFTSHPLHEANACMFQAGGLRLGVSPDSKAVNQAQVSKTWASAHGEKLQADLRIGVGR